MTVVLKQQQQTLKIKKTPANFLIFKDILEKRICQMLRLFTKAWFERVTPNLFVPSFASSLPDHLFFVLSGLWGGSLDGQG